MIIPVLLLVWTFGAVPEVVGTFDAMPECEKVRDVYQQMANKHSFLQRDYVCIEGMRGFSK